MVGLGAVAEGGHKLHAEVLPHVRRGKISAPLARGFLRHRPSQVDKFFISCLVSFFFFYKKNITLWLSLMEMSIYIWLSLIEISILYLG